MERRQTKNKQRILELFEREHLFTLKELAERLPNIDASTLYRNLKRFVEDGELREVHLLDKQTFWERAHDEHFHFVCDGCAQVDVMHVPAGVITRHVPKGTQPKHITLTVHGICKACTRA